MDSRFFPQAGFLQFTITFGKPDANLDKVREMLSQMKPERGALIALPELWAYGFDYDHAADFAGRTPSLLQELTSLTAEREIILAGSLLEKQSDGEEDEVLYNTLYFVGPDGVLGSYRKQHLFTPLLEDLHFAPGGPFYPVSSPIGMMGGLVCYDLRFPEFARSQAFHGARVIVVTAEWPQVRIDHWQALVRARAIENQVFVVACNSCGKTGDTLLGGCSMVVGPDGSVLLEAGDGEEGRVTGLDEQVLVEARSRFCPAGERPRPVRDSEKNVELPLLMEKLAAIRKQGGQVAFTNGCFDILHSGHVAYLEKARNTADCLVVGLNSDSSVRRIKGKERPVNQEMDRARILSALACVDFVVIFEEETPQNLITAILPDVLVKGADWAEDDIVGAREVKEAGGRVVRIAFEHDVSTTRLINRIQSGE